MQARLSFASILLLTASSAWLALAQQSSQTGAFMSDRDKAGLRGPVKTVLEEQTFSGADGQQSFTTTTTQYAPDGRILEDRTGNADGSGWVKSYAYYSDGHLLKTAFGKPKAADVHPNNRRSSLPIPSRARFPRSQDDTSHLQYVR